MRRQTWLLTVVATLGACAQTPQISASAPIAAAAAEQVLTLRRDAAPQAISLRAGQTLALKLESNASTGYSWALESPPPAGLAQVGESAYSADAYAEGIVGSGGTEIWRFKAVAAGDYALQMVYRRPWIKTPEPTDERLQIAVSVLGAAAP